MAKLLQYQKATKVTQVLKGADGHSITITSNTEEPNGDRKLVFSDNTTVVIPKGAKGDKGDNGQNGASITITRTETDAAGNTIIHFSDGKNVTVPKAKTAHQLVLNQLLHQLLVKKL